MAYHQVCDQSSTKGATRKAGAACPSGAHEFTPDFSGVVVARSLVFFVVFLRLLVFFCPFSFDYCIVCTFDLQILITPLVSSNFSYLKTITWIEISV